MNELNLDSVIDLQMKVIEEGIKKEGMKTDNHTTHDIDYDDNGAAGCAECSVKVCRVCKTTIEDEAMWCPLHGEAEGDK